ncbi:MAG: diphosphomevalonate/mevalonate 3,5-bisphosphate decarboxylase family protein [Lutibacter sp.]
MYILKETDFKISNSSLNLLEKGVITCQSPSNIALVKYWGKEANQIPKNPSISFTLDACFTQTKISFSKKEKESENFDFDVYFEGHLKEDFKPKIQLFFERIETYLPFLKSYYFKIETRNSFPHSSGIASSASGLSALALCLMQLEKKMNPNISHEYLIKKTSFLARLGSGSASRSVEGPVVIWGPHPKIAGSSDLYGVKPGFKVHRNFKNYHDTILLVDVGEKQVSSTIGHGLMNNHPFAKERFSQANQNINALIDILQNGNLIEFINLVESEALTLHAMMLTSNPYFILMKPNTLKIIEKIWDFRKETNCPICFTLDAGANVHILFPENEKERVNNFITSKLLKYCYKNHYICDRIGLGAKLLSNN